MQQAGVAGSGEQMETGPGNCSCCKKLEVIAGISKKQLEVFPALISLSQEKVC